MHTHYVYAASRDPNFHPKQSIPPIHLFRNNLFVPNSSIIPSNTPLITSRPSFPLISSQPSPRPMKFLAQKSIYMYIPLQSEYSGRQLEDYIEEIEITSLPYVVLWKTTSIPLNGKLYLDFDNLNSKPSNWQIKIWVLPFSAHLTI